jgi:hypothetical protein
LKKKKRGGSDLGVAEPPHMALGGGSAIPTKPKSKKIKKKKRKKKRKRFRWFSPWE